MRDMHSNVKVIHALTPQAVGTTGSANGITSGVLDRRGYDTVEFVFSSGTTGTTGDTITPVIFESSATGSGFTSVANDDLVGLETALTLTAAKSGQVGYRGNKRYLKIKLYGVGTATALVAASMLAGKASRAPVN